MWVSQQQQFRAILQLQSKRVVGALQNTGKRFAGRIVNTMFDSFLLEEDSGARLVVPFSNILFLDEIPQG